MTRRQPSRIGRWLLGLRTGAERRSEVERDLEELFHLRHAERGRWYAEWRWLMDAASVRPMARVATGRRPAGPLDAIWQDLRVGARGLAAGRRFTAVAVIVLALGIGATTAVFSVVNAVLLRPLPYVNPDRLVAVTSLYVSAERQASSRVIVLTDMADWRSRVRSFASMGAFAYTQLPVRVGDSAFSPVTALVDAELLPTLGNPPALGTFFEPGQPAGSDRTAIVSHAMWTEAFGGDPSVVGRAVTIDGEPFVIRGVLARDFQFPRSDASYFSKPVDLIMPASAYPQFPADSRQWFGIARLADDVTLLDAEAELKGIAEGLSRNADTGDAWSVRLAPLADETTARAWQPLVVLLGISLVLLLIASTNLMNLCFARSVGRMRELSVRRALGSTTWRLLRLLVVESLLLSIAGGLLGVWLAALAISAIVALSPVHLPVTQAIDLDGTVLAFTLIVCVGTAMAAGVVPALHVSARADEAVRTPGMRASAARGAMRIQQVLCSLQIACGVALLAAAGLLANSLLRLHDVDPGFDAHGVLGFNLSVPSDVPFDERPRFYAAALDEVRTIPGVERAGMISFLPPETRAGVFMGLAIEGAPEPPRGSPAKVVNTLVTSVDFFETLRMPIVRGRAFARSDRADRPPVVIVNEAFVRRYLSSSEEPLGRRIGTGFDGMTPVREIVGVVGDAQDRGLAVEPYPTAYLPFTQFSLPYSAIVVRTNAPVESLVPVIRDRVRRLNAAVPLTDFELLTDRLHESLREPRFYTFLAATCAGMAVLFVTFGLYGLVSYSVGRRTAELGIRLAIGARRGAIVGLVLAQGARMALAGVAAGLGLAVLSSRALESLLFEVAPIDVPTFAAAAAVVIMVTFAASYAPARRASRLDPVAALRQD